MSSSVYGEGRYGREDRNPDARNKIPVIRPVSVPLPRDTEAVTVTSQNLSAAGPCALATQAQAIEGWAAPWAGVPCGADRACHAGSERHASQPGTAGSVAVVRVFALRLTAPLRGSVRRAALSHGRRPRPRPPVCQRLQGYRAARCPHGSPSLARPTAPLPMALPLWGRALAWLVRKRRQRRRLLRSPRPWRPPRIPGPRQQETARRPSPESSYAVACARVAT